MQLPVVRNILEANDRISAELKELFKTKKILVLNLISSPGSGKTSTLERTLTDLRDELNMAVIEGDILTDNDARRVAATGAQAVQINTDGACHLDSSMVMEALKSIDMKDLDILFVENVGNLFCPAECEVGEDYKISLLSVTEGDDKPEKYPLLFAESAVMLMNKTDLLPYVNFDMDRAKHFATALNKDISVFPISCTNGDGLGEWYDWLRTKTQEKKALK